MNASFWHGKKVFVTGHTGFKGGWLCLWLQQLGAEVTGYALKPPTNPSLFEVAKLANGMNSIIGDVRDATTLTQAMGKAMPEIVIHMAAQPLVRYSYDNPVETYATNVLGCVHLFEAIRQAKSVKAVVNVTTDKCYENKEWVWGYRENEPLGGYDPYSSSKACAELVTSAYRNSFFNPVKYDEHGIALASARAGNVIGGGDWALDRLIPDIMRSIAQGESVRIRNPRAIRPWQHVLDPLSGYLVLAEHLYNGRGAYCESWNFGPHELDARSVQWIVEQLTQRWGDGACWEIDNNPQPHEASFLRLDCSKAHSQLGWQPRWNLKSALEAIVDWYIAYKHGDNMRQKTIQQIEAYSAPPDPKFS